MVEKRFISHFRYLVKSFKKPYVTDYWSASYSEKELERYKCSGGKCHHPKGTLKV